MTRLRNSAILLASLFALSACGDDVNSSGSATAGITTVPPPGPTTAPTGMTAGTDSDGTGTPTGTGSASASGSTTEGSASEGETLGTTQPANPTTSDEIKLDVGVEQTTGEPDTD